jgi:membrane-bound ClpP family serine protease
MIARLLGLLLLIAGIVLSFNFETNNIHFFAGIITGAGVPWLLTGKFRFWKWKYPEPEQ